MVRDRHFLIVLGSGLCLGLVGALLAVLGNPENSGICVSCFIENSAGALGLHNNARLQYLRPELIGFVLGAAISAVQAREFRSRGGSAPLVRLFGGFFLIVGCTIFIGCPIKLFLRLTAGDLTASPGFIGLVAGVWGGVYCFKHGVDLGRPLSQEKGSGFLLPIFFILLLIFFLGRPAFLLFSTRGSSSQYAPWIISLGTGLLLGVLAQRSRFCITGGIRDTILMGRRSPLFWGGLAFVLAALITNIATGRFHLGMTGQPGSHSELLWSFLGMALVGWLSVLIGGCPFRQLIKSGEGDTDAGLVVIGMFIGGGLVQSWDIAATTAGVPENGKTALLTGLIFVLGLAFLWRQREVRSPDPVGNPEVSPAPIRSEAP
jgi:uncharacterized protein